MHFIIDMLCRMAGLRCSPYALMQAALYLEIILDAPQLSLKSRRIFAPIVDSLFIPNKLYGSDFR